MVKKSITAKKYRDYKYKKTNKKKILERKKTRKYKQKRKYKKTRKVKKGGAARRAATAAALAGTVLASGAAVSGVTGRAVSGSAASGLTASRSALTGLGNSRVPTTYNSGFLRKLYPYDNLPSYGAIKPQLLNVAKLTNKGTYGTSGTSGNYTKANLYGEGALLAATIGAAIYTYYDNLFLRAKRVNVETIEELLKKRGEMNAKNCEVGPKGIDEGIMNNIEIDNEIAKELYDNELVDIEEAKRLLGDNEDVNCTELECQADPVTKQMLPLRKSILSKRKSILSKRELIEKSNEKNPLPNLNNVPRKVTSIKNGIVMIPTATSGLQYKEAEEKDDSGEKDDSDRYTNKMTQLINVDNDPPLRIISTFSYNTMDLTKQDTTPRHMLIELRKEYTAPYELHRCRCMTSHCSTLYFATDKEAYNTMTGKEKEYKDSKGWRRPPTNKEKNANHLMYKNQGIDFRVPVLPIAPKGGPIIFSPSPVASILKAKHWRTKKDNLVLLELKVLLGRVKMKDPEEVSSNQKVGQRIHHGTYEDMLYEDMLENILYKTYGLTIPHGGYDSEYNSEGNEGGFIGEEMTIMDTFQIVGFKECERLKNDIDREYEARSKETGDIVGKVENGLLNKPKDGWSKKGEGMKSNNVSKRHPLNPTNPYTSVTKHAWLGWEKKELIKIESKTPQPKRP